MAVIAPPPATNALGAWENTAPKSSEPVDQKIMNIATMKPKSPIRFMMNALRPASALSWMGYQKPISK